MSKARYEIENFTCSTAHENFTCSYMYTEKYKEKPYNGLNFTQSPWAAFYTLYLLFLDNPHSSLAIRELNLAQSLNWIDTICLALFSLNYGSSAVQSMDVKASFSWEILLALLLWLRGICLVHSDQKPARREREGNKLNSSLDHSTGGPLALSPTLVITPAFPAEANDTVIVSCLQGSLAKYRHFTLMVLLLRMF